MVFKEQSGLAILRVENAQAHNTYKRQIVRQKKDLNVIYNAIIQEIKINVCSAFVGFIVEN